MSGGLLGKEIKEENFSFQAPDFYKKMGYKEVFVREDYPVTDKRYYYVKELR